ncbi:hypothetical protein CRYUN_Cryun05aG0107300 [Craigia yunnanensis]
MQDNDPNLLGYYQKMKVIDKKLGENEDGDDIKEYFEDELERLDDDVEEEEEEEEEENFVDNIEGKFEGIDVEEFNLVEGEEFDWDSDE